MTWFFHRPPDMIRFLDRTVWILIRALSSDPLAKSEFSRSLARFCRRPLVQHERYGFPSPTSALPSMLQTSTKKRPPLFRTSVYTGRLPREFRGTKYAGLGGVERSTADLDAWERYRVLARASRGTRSFVSNHRIFYVTRHSSHSAGLQGLQMVLTVSTGAVLYW